MSPISCDPLWRSQAASDENRVNSRFEARLDGWSLRTCKSRYRCSLLCERSKTCERHAPAKERTSFANFSRLATCPYFCSRYCCSFLISSRKLSIARGAPFAGFDDLPSSFASCVGGAPGRENIELEDDAAPLIAAGPDGNCRDGMYAPEDEPPSPASPKRASAAQTSSLPLSVLDGLTGSSYETTTSRTSWRHTSRAATAGPIISREFRFILGNCFGVVTAKAQTCRSASLRPNSSGLSLTFPLACACVPRFPFRYLAWSFYEHLGRTFVASRNRVERELPIVKQAIPSLLSITSKEASSDTGWPFIAAVF